MEERKSLIGRAGVVATGTLVSRILGLARDMVFAAVFRKEETDAFFAAFTFPNALRQLLGEGAVSSAVVPVMAATLESEGKERTAAFYARLRGAFFLLSVVLTVLAMVFARPFTRLFAGGYEGEAFERTVSMTRWVFPYIVFISSASLGAAALNTNRKFALTAFAPALLNIAFIVCAFVFPSFFAARGIDPGHAMVVGALVGGILQAVVQVPALRRIGFGGMFRFRGKDPLVSEVFRRLLPMLLGVGIYYVDLVLSRSFLSSEGAGAQSYFTWASRICDFPQGIFVLAISSVALPSLSALAKRADWTEFDRTVSLGLRLSLFVAIPATVFVVWEALPLVRLFFERGKFNAEASMETSRSLMFQGASIVCVTVVRQLVAAFHSMGNTRTPMWVSFWDLLVFVGAALFLRRTMGHAGIAAAVGLSSLAQAVLLGIRFASARSDFPWKEVLRSFGMVLGISAVGGSIASTVAGSLALGSRMEALLALVLFGMVFLLLSRVLKNEEWLEIESALQRKLRRGKVVQDPQRGP